MNIFCDETTTSRSKECPKWKMFMKHKSVMVRKFVKKKIVTFPIGRSRFPAVHREMRHSIPRLIITWLTQSCKQLQRYQRWCHALRYRRDTPLLWSWVRKDNILDKHYNKKCVHAQTEEKTNRRKAKLHNIYNMWYLIHDA